MVGIIKKLKWRNMTACGQKVGATAFGVRTFYMVLKEDDGSWTLMHPGTSVYGRTPGYETQVAAKNAAQVCFERRVHASFQDQKEE